jgi:hypothetical protein
MLPRGGPRQQGQVVLDDDAIETVVYESQQAAKAW